MVLGIDASNIRAGGGVTHLSELLNHLIASKSGITKVLVFAPTNTLDKLPKFDWIEKKSNWFLNKNFISRLFWQWFIFPSYCKAKVDILFNPGGTFIGGFHPYISMSQNMLVFDKKERARYGASWERLRIKLLEFVQSRSIKNSDGTIFISNYAKEIISNKIKVKDYCVIPHGISNRFKQEPRAAKKITEYSSNSPLKILYVSIVDVYKHQWNVVKAINRLYEVDKFPIELHLVGPSYPPALQILEKTVRTLTSSNCFLKLHGNVPYKKIEKLYKNADIFVFASTCENMPNIILEAMSAGLPISSSKSMPMPEFLKDMADYFNPEDPNSIYVSLKRLILDTDLRNKYSKDAFVESSHYSWSSCSKKTIDFIATVYANYHRNVLMSS